MTRATEQLPIFFVTVVLNKEVHMQALGFTKQFYKYVCALSADEAALLAEAWARQRGCDVRNDAAVAREATSQDAGTYTFPHQIINLPNVVLESIYDRRNYPPSYRDPGQHVDPSDLPVLQKAT